MNLPEHPRKPVDFADFVDRLGDAACAATLPFFRARFTADNKLGDGGFDPVTEADRAAEVAMRRLIKAHFPEHGIIGEEFGEENTDAEYVWVLDPVDGTRAFMSGLPVWGVLIGLMRQGKPVYGMMVQPFTGERFSGDGQAAQWRRGSDSRILRVRPCPSLNQATLMTTSPDLFKGTERDAYDRVERAVRLARYGCDCYAYCMLAMGQIDHVVETGLKLVDYIPLIPIIEGAGGIVTDWQGQPAGGDGRVVVSGDSARHREVLALMQGES
jgi:histidinol phosphatase-like enzyme (inositol monophosphatase family)